MNLIRSSCASASSSSSHTLSIRRAQFICHKVKVICAREHKTLTLHTRTESIIWAHTTPPPQHRHWFDNAMITKDKMLEIQDTECLMAPSFEFYWFLCEIMMTAVVVCTFFSLLFLFFISFGMHSPTSIHLICSNWMFFIFIPKIFGIGSSTLFLCSTKIVDFVIIMRHLCYFRSIKIRCRSIFAPVMTS